MLRLITLGGLALTRDGAPYAGAAAQRRRLALLAVLAALNQALFQIRQALGSESVATANTTLALNPAVVTSDVADFERTSGDHALEQAATLYQGPFLDGFFLSDAPDSSAGSRRCGRASRGRGARSRMRWPEPRPPDMTGPPSSGHRARHAGPHRAR